MPPPADTERYKHHRFPSDILSHGVWLSSRFLLSERDVPELLCERGIAVTHEAIRPWGRKFGQAYATQRKRRRPRTGDTWHLDEVWLTMHGKRHDLWRAVDQDDHVLDTLMQSRRSKQAAKKFLRTLLTGLPYVPRVRITEKRKSDGAAQRERLPGVEHRQSRSLNNHCEHSHRPTRQREERMQGLKSVGHAPRFVSAYGPIPHHC
jgi:putative transposase